MARSKNGSGQIGCWVVTASAVTTFLLVVVVVVAGVLVVVDVLVAVVVFVDLVLDAFSVVVVRDDRDVDVFMEDVFVVVLVSFVLIGSSSKSKFMSPRKGRSCVEVDTGLGETVESDLDGDSFDVVELSSWSMVYHVNRWLVSISFTGLSELAYRSGFSVSLSSETMDPLPRIIEGAFTGLSTSSLSMKTPLLMSPLLSALLF